MNSKTALNQYASCPSFRSKREEGHARVFLFSRYNDTIQIDIQKPASCAKDCGGNVLYGAYHTDYHYDVFLDIIFAARYNTDVCNF